MRDFDRFSAEINREITDGRRQFRRFRNFIIVIQVLVVVGFVWLLTHPEAIGSWLHRLLTAAGA